MLPRFLMRWATSIIINAIALIVVAELFKSFHIADFGTALLASIILSMLNLVIKPILVIFTLPITVVTFGFFLFVIQAITLMIAQSFMSPAFSIDSFGVAILAAIVISVLNTILHRLVKDIVR